MWSSIPKLCIFNLVDRGKKKQTSKLPENITHSVAKDQPVLCLWADDSVPQCNQYHSIHDWALGQETAHWAFLGLGTRKYWSPCPLMALLSNLFPTSGKTSTQHTHGVCVLWLALSWSPYWGHPCRMQSASTAFTEDCMTTDKGHRLRGSSVQMAT